MSCILQVKDENGNWISVPGLGGPKGEKGDKGDRGDPGPAGSPGGSKPNLLDNWYFADPINQRGFSAKTTTGATAGYTIDRWQDPAWETLLSLGNGALVISGQGGTGFLDQHLEFGKSLPFPLTASVKIKNGEVYHRVITEYGIGQVTEGLSIQLVNSTWVTFRITVENGYSFAIEAVKLELGTQQTLAHQDENGNWILNDPPPNKVTELLKCQRYQISLSPLQSYSQIGFGTVESSTKAVIIVPLPCEMRVVPSLQYDGIYQVRQANATDKDVSAIVVDQYSKNCVRLTCTISGGTSGQACHFRAKNSKGSMFLLDANL